MAEPTTFFRNPRREFMGQFHAGGESCLGQQIEGKETIDRLTKTRFAFLVQPRTFRGQIFRVPGRSEYLGQLSIQDWPSGAAQ